MSKATVAYDFFKLDTFGFDQGPEMVKQARQAEAAQRTEAETARRLDLDYMLDAINRNALEGMENRVPQAAAAAAPVKRKRRHDWLDAAITAAEWGISSGIVLLTVILAMIFCA